MLITVFFSINLFILFYFGNFSHSKLPKMSKESTGVSDDKVPSHELDHVEEVVELDHEKGDDSVVKKKESVLSRRNVLIGLIAYIFVPFVDNITDLALLLSDKFASYLPFSLFVLFFCLPGVYFFKTLIEMKAVPKVLLSSSSSSSLSLPLPSFISCQCRSGYSLKSTTVCTRLLVYLFYNYHSYYHYC